MNCAGCGHYDLLELGALGRRVHYRCRACGLEQSLVGFSEARLRDLSRQHRLDGAGYAWENAAVEPFASLGCVALDDPDFSYLTGEQPEAARGRSCVFYWAPSRSDVAWPGTHAVELENDSIVYRRVQTGYFLDRDVECDCQGQPDASSPDGWEFTGSSTDPHWDGCPWCEGDGWFMGDGGEWAVYVVVDDIAGPLSEIAQDLAEMHAAAPEVLAAGGPSAADVALFDDTGLGARLVEADLPVTPHLLEALREALRAALEDCEIEYAEALES